MPPSWPSLRPLSRPTARPAALRRSALMLFTVAREGKAELFLSPLSLLSFLSLPRPLSVLSPSAARAFADLPNAMGMVGKNPELPSLGEDQLSSS